MFQWGELRVKRWALVLGSAMAATAVAFLNPLSVFASCNPNRANDYLYTRWQGWSVEAGVQVGGVQAQIGPYAPWKGAGLGNQSTVWVMLAAGTTNWAQAGNVQYAFNQRNWFIQWTANGTYYTNEYPYDTTNPHVNKVLFANGNFDFLFDNVLQFRTGASFIPTRAIVDGETDTLANQMFGAVNNVEVLDYSALYTDGAWHNFNDGNPWFAAYQENPYLFGWRTPWDPSHHIDIWDFACNT